MKFLNYDTKTTAIEKKSIGFESLGSINPINNTGYFSTQYVSPGLAYDFYEKIAPVSNAVDRVVSAMVEIPVYFRNSKTNEIIRKHPFLSMLNNQITPFDSTQVWRELFLSYLLTGSAYPIFIGKFGSQPTYLSYVKGFEASPTIASYNNVNGYMGRIITSTTYETDTYHRIIVDDQFRFVNKDLEKEIRQIAKEYSKRFLIAKSPLSGCANIVTLYSNLLDYNISLLDNNYTSPCIIAPKNAENLSAEMIEAFGNQIRENYEGFKNAGSALIPNIPVEYIQTNNKALNDMQYKNLYDITMKSLYDAFKIPQPLYSEKTTTMANSENADSSIYEQAVLPAGRQFLRMLSKFLKVLYPDLKNLELAFDLSTVPALKQQVYQEAQFMVNLGVSTVNEVRKVIGLEELETGGDSIVQPKTVNGYIANTEDKPEPVEDTSEEGENE